MAYQGQTQSSPAVTSKYFQDDGQSGDTPAAAIDPGGARTRLGNTTDAAAPIGTENVGVIALLKGVLTKLPSLMSGRIPVDAGGAIIGTLATQATLSNVNVDTNAISAKLDNQATAANQDAGNAFLLSIDGRLTDNATNTTLQALVDLITPETPFTDQKALVTANAEVLSSVSRPSKINITVAAPSTNANPVYVGPSGVTVGTGDIVEPGQRLVLTGYTNANQVFAIDGVGGSANKLTFSGS